MSVLICGFDDSNHAGDRKGDIIAGVFSTREEDAVVEKFKNRRDRELFRRWFSQYPEQRDYRFTELHDEFLRRIQPNLPLVAPFLINSYLSSASMEFDAIKIYFDGILKRWHKDFLRDIYSARFEEVTIDNFVKKQNIHQCPTAVYIADILSHDIYEGLYSNVIENEKRVIVDETRLLRVVNRGKR